MIKILIVVPRSTRIHIPNRLAFQFEHFNFFRFFANFDDVTPYKKCENCQKSNFQKSPDL